jgi:hypothetical protein
MYVVEEFTPTPFWTFDKTGSAASIFMFFVCFSDPREDIGETVDNLAWKGRGSFQSSWSWLSSEKVVVRAA